MQKPNLEIDTHKTMNDIGDMVMEQIGPKYGFTILIFPYSTTEGVAHYISSAAREDMVVALREQANALEARLDI